MPMGKGTYGSKVGRPPMKKKKDSMKKKKRKSEVFMTENKPNKLIGLDGMTRESKDEENLNTLCFGVFNTVSGKES